LVIPLIMRSGCCSIPGWCIGTANADSPLCFGTSGFVACEQEAPVGDVGVAGPNLVPVDSRSRYRRASLVVRSAARSDPASGSLKP
jgi:hypothetical protein